MGKLHIKQGLSTLGYGSAVTAQHFGVKLVQFTTLGVVPQSDLIYNSSQLLTVDLKDDRHNIYKCSTKQL